VLFYVGYWLHTKSEAEKWRAFIQDKVQGVLPNRNVWALIGVSFFAVYREAFEVVLFYQALWLQTETGREPVLWGFISGVLTLIISAYAIFKLGLRIPVKYFFAATGLLLYFLAFIFAGQGVNELQTAGWVSITPLDFTPTTHFLGVYPTLETLSARA
jgi:high-affinity iron transporter